MERASTRDILQSLADQPIGSPELQFEADRVHEQQGLKPSAALIETKKRATKLWLPQGKKSSVRGACNDPSAVQTDIEDAVAERGGHRGSTERQAP
jgi:hypothetical protein